MTFYERFKLFRKYPKTPVFDHSNYRLFERIPAVPGTSNNRGLTVLQNALREHSAILSTSIKLPSALKTFVLSFFEWLLRTGFTIVSLFLFVWFDSLHHINNLSVIMVRVFLGWTSTKLGLMFFNFFVKIIKLWHKWIMDTHKKTKQT